jgi:putative FmdB family regulatory protein
MHSQAPMALDTRSTRTYVLSRLSPAPTQSSRPSEVREEHIMATYLYHCLACGHDFDRAESMSQHEHAHPACPKCKSTKVEQVLAPFFAKTGRKA